MKDQFDRRWKAAIDAAGPPDSEASDFTAPLGFATRVVAHWQSERISAGDVPAWQSLALAFLGFTAIALVVVVGLDLLIAPQNQQFSPGMEDTVGEQLPWFQT